MKQPFFRLEKDAVFFNWEERKKWLASTLQINFIYEAKKVNNFLKT